MTQIPKSDWDRVHALASDIANASSEEDDILADSRTSALIDLLTELEREYGEFSRITATRADYAEEEDREMLYELALRQARAEGDTENETLILESLAEIRNEI